MKIICAFFSFIILSLSAQATMEVDLTEDAPTRPVMLVMYAPSAKVFNTQLTDARESFPSYKKGLSGKNSFVMTLKAREEVTFTKGQITYHAPKDGDVLFGVLLGVSGSLSTHTGPIHLHKDFYWPGAQEKEGAENVTTVLAFLRHWGEKVGVADVKSFTQRDLCTQIEDKLQEK